MPRSPRIQYEGAIYHVISRGDRREAIYADDQDRKMFLRTLEEACQRVGMVKSRRRSLALSLFTLVEQTVDKFW